FAGLLAWMAFNNTLTKANASLVANSALVSKVYFPRVILPISTLGSTLIDFSVGLGMMIVLLAGYSINPGWRVLLLPAWLLLALGLGLGIGLAAAAWSVRYRDVAYVMPVLVQFLLYASPVAYSLKAVPRGVRVFFDINPLTGVLEAFRWSLLGR